MLCPDIIKVVTTLTKVFDNVKQLDRYAKYFNNLSFDDTLAESDWSKDLPEQIKKMSEMAFEWLHNDPNVWNNLKVSFEKCADQFGAIASKNKLYVSRKEWFTDLDLVKRAVERAQQECCDAIRKTEDQELFLDDMCEYLENQINHGEQNSKYNVEEINDLQIQVTLKVIHQVLVSVSILMKTLHYTLLQLHPIWDELKIKIEEIQGGLAAKKVPSSFCDLLNFKQATDMWFYIKDKLIEKEVAVNSSAQKGSGKTKTNKSLPLLSSTVLL